MGYTHYFTPKPASDENWDAFVEDCKTLHKALPSSISIRGGLGTGRPLFGEILNKNVPQNNTPSVCFNGDEKLGEDHETLLIKKDGGKWDFCKTARKPYDLLVVAVLLAAKYHLGYEVSSDGDLEDWKDGITFYVNTLYVEMSNEEKIEIIKSLLIDDHKKEEIEFLN